MIEQPGAALHYALGAMAFALRTRLFHRTTPGAQPMPSLIERPRQLVATCALAATALGLVYLGLAGAPLRYLAVNGLALAIGLALVAVLSVVVRATRFSPGMACLGLGLVLALLGQIGTAVNGAVRWVSLGGLAIQPSLILVPLVVLTFARAPDRRGLAGIALTAAALALQPDRAMSAALAAGLGMLASRATSRLVLVALGVAVAGFVATLLRPDLQPAMPFVDQIVHTAFFVHPLAAVAVLGGLATLLAPLVLARRVASTAGLLLGVFGATWLAIVIAAYVANYPTPLVGYSGSAIIGYVLAMLALPHSASRVVVGGLAAQAEREAANEQSVQRVSAA
jgi:cell division protein FtsW (lipid II flippase)